MGISSSGLGDQIGGPTQLGARELEATAIAQLTKAALGMVADSIEISFVKLGGNLWKYAASSSRPTLAPLESARQSTLEKAEDKSWKAFFDQLIENLPSEIAARLIREKQKAKEERSVPYMALEEVLVTTAKALSFIQSASKVNEPASAAYINALANLLVADNAALHLNRLGKEFFKEAHQFLESVGSNYVHHDKLSHDLQEAEKILNHMEILNKKGG